MKYLHLFEDYNKIYTGQEVADDFLSWGEGHGDEEHTEVMYSRIKTFNYTLETISIQEILSYDESLAEFINAIEDEDEEFLDGREFGDMEDCYDCPIIIAEWSTNQKAVIDGYHRIAEHIRNGDDQIEAYIYIK